MYFNKNIIYLFLVLGLYAEIARSQSNTPPKIIAIGNQAYCPLSKTNIVTDFDIIDPDESEIKALYIQISTGYRLGEDVLSLSNVSDHPNITVKWSVSEAKLTLESSDTGIERLNDIIAAAKDVIFESSSLNIFGEKFFSFTIGNANYLPSTGHYYEFVPKIGITWTQARNAAAGLNFYGLQGYLATITRFEEAKLSGEQAAGAGWIGGSDAAVEGQWEWVTGPEAGTNDALFYRGQYPTGNTVTYSFWNTLEPNNLGDEDYAHITARNVGIRGSWNDLSNTGGSSGDYQPKGYIVEYGGMPGDPMIDISAFTKIYIPALDSIQDGSTCGAGKVTLTAEPADISPSAQVHWFDTDSSTAPLFTGTTFITPILYATRSYYVLASENSCFDGIRTEVVTNVFEIPVIQASVELKNCDEDGNPDGFVDFNLREADEFISLGDDSLIINYYISYSNADKDMNPIDPSPFNNASGSIVYARVENIDGCHDIATVTLKVSTTTFPPGFDQKLNACDDDDTIDGLSTFDLTEASDFFLAQLPPDQNLTVQYYRNLTDAQLEENEILPQNNYKNEIPFLETLYVRVESTDNGDCFGIGPHLVLNVDPRPEFDVIPNEFVCLNLPPITLRTMNPSDNYTYEWTDESGNIIGTQSNLEVSSGGKYTVIATSNLNCRSFPKTVTVDESIVATITEEDITVIDDSDNNSITIHNANNNLGIGDYEFALDNAYGLYQDEPYFENIIPGIHTIYVRDKNNCGIAMIEVPVIGFPKFFTPNSDGYNDTWQVLGINEFYYPTSMIYIYDRFGKPVFTMNATGEGWNGFYNGYLLPSNDYWFSVLLTDKNGITRERQGHFSLIIR